MTLKELIQLLKPKFYNRITWMIVAAGIALLSKPLWIEVLEYFLETELNIDIPNINDQILGLVVIVIGLVYNVIMGMKSGTNNKLLHDQSIFKKFDSKLSESRLNNIWGLLIGSSMISSDDIQAVEDYIEKSKYNSNKYLNRKVEKAKLRFVNSLQKLTDFMAPEFFTHPNNQLTDRIFLRPDWDFEKTGNYDEKLASKLNNLRNKLKKIAFASEKEYKAFRKVIKNQLKK